MSMKGEQMTVLAVGVLAAACIVSEADGQSDYRFSYYGNGRICVDELSEIDGRDPIMVPPERGWEDFKPSWSKTGDMLVFFRRVKNDPVVVKWKTVLCIVKGRLFLYKLADGSTQQVSRNDAVDFRYPHVEDTPK